VLYPVAASAAMNEKMICAEKSRLLARAGDPNANAFADRAAAAMARMEQLTDHYNSLCDGKWRGMMNAHPRKLPVFDMPPVARVPANAAIAPSPATKPSDDDTLAFDAIHFTRATECQGVHWVPIDALGRRDGALALFPRTRAATLLTPGEIEQRAPVVEYAVHATNEAIADVIVEALPTQPLTPAHKLICAISLDDEPPTVVEFAQSDDELDTTWQRNALRNAMFARTKTTVPKGDHVLKLFGCDASVVVQRITLDFGHMQPSYLGPPRAAPDKSTKPNKPL
jgi:hypothetical protein